MIVIDCTFVSLSWHIGLLYTVSLLLCVNEWWIQKQAIFVLIPHVKVVL